jgi:aminomethyltransferase
VPCIISRTGYTGEDGFELYHDPSEAHELWQALTARPGVVPTGLGARDILRLEVFLALYGNDIDDETTPLEAGLGRIVKLKKADFVGKASLLELKARGLKRKLVGFRLTEKGFPRHGMPVIVNGSEFGAVRSGTVSPSTGEAIGTAYLPVGADQPGTAFAVDIRGRKVGAEVVTTPFYTQGSRRA